MGLLAPIGYVAGIALIVWGVMTLGGIPAGAIMLGIIIIIVTGINS